MQEQKNKPASANKIVSRRFILFFLIMFGVAIMIKGRIFFEPSQLLFSFLYFMLFPASIIFILIFFIKSSSKVANNKRSLFKLVVAAVIFAFFLVFSVKSFIAFASNYYLKTPFAFNGVVQSINCDKRVGRYGMEVEIRVIDNQSKVHRFDLDRNFCQHNPGIYTLPGTTVTLQGRQSKWGVVYDNIPAVFQAGVVKLPPTT